MFSISMCPEIPFKTVDVMKFNILGVPGIKYSSLYEDTVKAFKAATSEIQKDHDCTLIGHNLKDSKEAMA
jgi:hypothetical protein